MPTVLQSLVGVMAVVLGIAWVLAPVKMSRLQARFVYFDRPEDADGPSDTAILAGRVTGALLAVLGTLILGGILP